MSIIIEAENNRIMHTSSTDNIKHNEQLLSNILNKIIKVQSGDTIDGYIAVASNIGNMTYDEFLNKIVDINKISLQEMQSFADKVSDPHYVMSLIDTPLNRISDMDFTYTQSSVDEIIVSKNISNILSSMEIFPFSYIIKVTDSELLSHPELLENGVLVNKGNIKYVMYRTLPTIGKEM